MKAESWRDFSEKVAKAYDLFWQKNKLSYKNGRIYRTTIPRVRPKANLDFRKRGKDEVQIKEF